MAAERGPGRRVSRRQVITGAAALAGTAAIGGFAGARLLSSGEKAPPAESPATPTRTTTPSPLPATATPSPSLAPSPTPTARSGVSVRDSLVVDADAVRIGHWGRGELIEWEHGLFFMDTRTGTVEGFQATNVDGANASGPIGVSPGGRFVGLRGANEGHFLHDRMSGQSYVSADGSWRLNNWTQDLLAFHGVAVSSSAPRPDDRIEIVLPCTFETVGRLTIPTDAFGLASLFAPNGSAFFLWSLPRYAQPVLLRVDLSSGRTDEVWRPFGGNPPAWGRIGWLRVGVGGMLEAWLNWGANPSSSDFSLPAGVTPYTRATLTWEGEVTEEAPAPELFGSRQYSPNGRFSVEAGYLRYLPPVHREGFERWPTVTVHQEPGHVPVLRVRSASSSYGDLADNRRWLADSSGFVAQIARVPADDWQPVAYGIFAPDGALIARLPEPPGGSNAPIRLRLTNAPTPAPDNADIFSFGQLTAFRRSGNSWLSANIPAMNGPMHLDPWATGTSDVMVFGLPHGGHDLAPAASLVSPAVERPPFSNSLLFRVAGTGSCVNLREGPGIEYPSIDCLPDGTRAGISERPGRSFEDSAAGPWVRVITDAGMEGWVSASYLAWGLDS